MRTCLFRVFADHDPACSWLRPLALRGGGVMLQAASAFGSTFQSRESGSSRSTRLGGHSPKSPRVTTPLKQCQESGPMNRAVRTIRGRRTRSWWHCTERAARCCQSCGANPAGHARRARWASTSESGAVTASTAQDRTEDKQSRRRATSAGVLGGRAFGKSARRDSRRINSVRSGL